MYTHFPQDLLHVIHPPVELYTVGYFYQKDMIPAKGVLLIYCPVSVLCFTSALDASLFFHCCNRLQ